MPPRIVPLVYKSGHGTWVCAGDPTRLYAWSNTHGRWTALLLMAELSVGHASFGEPQWRRIEMCRGDGKPSARWSLMWPCRACKAWFARPAAHRAHHFDADRLRVARMTSFGPLTDGA